MVKAQAVGVSVHGWRSSRKSGPMGNDYLFRAAFAKSYTQGRLALGALAAPTGAEGAMR